MSRRVLLAIKPDQRVFGLQVTDDSILQVWADSLYILQGKRCTVMTLTGFPCTDLEIIGQPIYRCLDVVSLLSRCA